MITSTLRLCRHAQSAGYGLAAVNILDDLSLRAVIGAAEQAGSPLIIQCSVKTVKSLGLESITSMFRLAATDSPIPLALHLDHCPDRAVLSSVIAAGWSSVLFDASDRSLADAERETAEVVAEAHAAGVDVESEIENIVGVEDGVGSDVALHGYTVQQLAEVAERTGADLLAPQLGTAHGMYKSEPVLVPDRARELREVSGRPVVLHGGTGLSEAQFGKFIAAGVSKINISTGIKRAYMMSAKAHLQRAAERDVWDPPSMFNDISAAVSDEMSTYLHTFGSAGQARAALVAVR